MQYIIFGAGSSGKKAAIDLGLERVDFFASNNLMVKKGNTEWVLNRKVLSFEDMINKCNSGNYMIVVASERYAIEMDAQLRENGIKKYFVYHEFDNNELWKLYPNYYLYRYVHTLNYAKVLNLYQIRKYKRIAIYGDNFFLPYLICEVAIQNDYDNIVGIIPHTTNKYGIRSAGVPVKNLNDVWDNIDCLIINVKFNQSDIRSKLDICEHQFEVIDIYDVDKFEPEYNHTELIRYKDIHKGKRVFVIGNGPSLRCEDLDRLNKNREICFGSNSIYKIFKMTKWRPNYLCFIDPIMISSSKTEINEFDGEVFLADVYHRYGIDFPNSSNINVVHQSADITEMYYPNKPGFSSDIKKGVCTSFSVTYFCIQLAAYMGASEIYLLGVDNTIAKNIHDTKHFASDYMAEAEGTEMLEIVEKVDLSMNIEMIEKGYMKAEEYSITHGFRIFNATRGGVLETFERVNFDSLFEE